MDSYNLKSPLGYINIIGDFGGIQSAIVSEEPKIQSSIVPVSLRACVEQLNAYFAGNLKKFSFKVNPQGTDFQKKVWEELLNIPYGKTISYLDLAKKLGDIKAIRAVASANGKNPLWIIIPCHRVIGSDGSLTGYAGGLQRKKWLLEHEGAIKQISLF